MKSIILDFCKKCNIIINQFFCKEKNEGDLDLNILATIPENFNPTVEGEIASSEMFNFSKLTTIPENFNPTVEGEIASSEMFNFSKLTTIPENFNPTDFSFLEDDLYLKILKINEDNLLNKKS